METVYSDLHEKYNSIFIHIPKVAGSSIEKALYGTKGKVTHRIAKLYYEENPEKFKDYFSFAFTRNPYDRFVSAYEYLRQGGRNKFDKEWADTYITPCSSFENFVLTLQDQNIRDQVCQWMHFKPQYIFVCDENKNVIVDFIGKYETIHTDFQKVTKRLGTHAQLPYENRTKIRNDYGEYYNEKTAKIVREIYSYDFELFGYDKNM